MGVKILFSRQMLKEMEKAYGRKDLSKLKKEMITDKNGHRKTVYHKIDKPEEDKKKNSSEQQQDSAPQYKGSVGDSISFKIHDKAGTRVIEGGQVTSMGTDGVIVVKEGIQYRVRNENIVKKTKNADGTIPADSFDANTYKSQFTDPKCTNDKDGINHVYDLLGSDGLKTRAMVEQKLNEQNRRMEKGDTKTRNQINGEYTSERKILHQEIANKILSPEKISACIPKNGEKPKFIMFGGRGGSGKSWFTDKERAAKDGREVMFDTDNYLKLDADEIKNELPEFKGWNAGEVHEESSDIMKQIKASAMDLGINIIIDGTMNYNPSKPDKVKNEMLEARAKGYTLEAHYMFTPLQKSCINAMNRFKTGKGDYSGRLVPTDILLSMQDNEKSFDSIKDIVDDWTFRDNQNFEAKLISQKGLQ